MTFANLLRRIADRLDPPRGIPHADRGDHLTDPEDEWPITGDSPL